MSGVALRLPGLTYCVNSPKPNVLFIMADDLAMLISVVMASVNLKHHDSASWLPA